MLTGKSVIRKSFLLFICILICFSLGVTSFADCKTNNKEVIVGGCLFGVRIYTDGVPVVGIDTVETVGGSSAPAYDAGIRLKDIIKSINGTSVNTTSQVIKVIASAGGHTLSITVLRNSEEKTFKVTPKMGKDGTYHIGLWLRDSAAGIGTVTYAEPDSLIFGGLGHGICDGETQSLMPLLRGNVTEVELLDVVKGQTGIPGELKGAFKGGKRGALVKNTETGVYGIFTTLPEGIGEKMPIATQKEIHEGEAKIRSSVSGKICEYSVRISKINRLAENGKNFVIEVTDPTLISITGGIVQGMSGSPVIQDGKLIGAVTHVLINSPTTGYGIFIENMIGNGL